jgi:hypothetical protein
VQFLDIFQAKGKRREIGWFPGSYVKILGPGGGSRQSSSRTTPIPFDEYEMPVTVAPVYSDLKGRHEFQFILIFGPGLG